MLEVYKTVLMLDDKGRVTIPVKVRDLLELKAKDALRLEFVAADGIIMIYPIFVEKGE